MCCKKVQLPDEFLGLVVESATFKNFNQAMADLTHKQIQAMSSLVFNDVKEGLLFFDQK